MRSSFILVLNGYSFFHQMDKVVIKLEFVVIMVNFVVIKCIFGVIHSDLVVIMVQNVVIVLKTNKKVQKTRYHRFSGLFAKSYSKVIFSTVSLSRRLMTSTISFTAFS